MYRCDGFRLGKFVASMSRNKCMMFSRAGIFDILFFYFIVLLRFCVINLFVWGNIGIVF